MLVPYRSRSFKVRFLCERPFCASKMAREALLRDALPGDSAATMESTGEAAGSSSVQILPPLISVAVREGPATLPVPASEKEARLLSQLLLLFSAKRASSTAVSDPESAAANTKVLIQQFLALPEASQKKLAQSLFVIPTTLIDNFASVLQFYMRVIIEAHARSHESFNELEAIRAAQSVDKDLRMSEDKNTDQREAMPCSWARNGHVLCVSYEQGDSVQEETNGSSSSTNSTSFQFPLEFHTCLIETYGSVKRSKCEEVWHGDHMAYRCRTCGLSDSSCMCLACFDPEDHEGHDFRVYRCSSGGCCDCGDPLAWKPEGFCKRHRAQNENDDQLQRKMQMGGVEREIVTLLVRRAVSFCVNVMREVYLFCLRPSSASENGDQSSLPMRKLPKTGRKRSSFPTVIQVHLDRLQQTLTWLQMLSVSCVRYRDILSQIFFEQLPVDFRLDPAASVEERDPSVNQSSSLTDRKTSDNESDDQNDEDQSSGHHVEIPRLLILDVFLKAGILLPVEICDVLGVLYLKLLFEHSFKQQYTCHFVDWYPFFIELYLKASEENNDDGMRNLSRFIDRLFCQLFHSTAQLEELEQVFALRQVTPRVRQHVQVQMEFLGETSSSCVEWLIVFLLDKLNGLFKSTIRVENIPTKKRRRKQGSISENSGAQYVQSIKVVDCGRNVFKKRIYARLCSDLRTLLVHPRLASKALLNSFAYVDGEYVLLQKSVYGQLIETFQVLQQMDLQQRHLGQHVEYESQNWTFAFVVDYELNMLFSAFLSSIPFFFSRKDWIEGELMNRPAPFNMLESDMFDPLSMASTILQPLKDVLNKWVQNNGFPEWRPDFDEESSSLSQLEFGQQEKAHLMDYYEQSDSISGSANKKSFHLPLHHMYAATIHAICTAVQPRTLNDWCTLLGLAPVGSLEDCTTVTDANSLPDLSFLCNLVQHPLRVCLFTREVKTGLWVRNGNVMWQQLIHYYSKHWRFYGLHSDLFLCQLGALYLPTGSFTRMLLEQYPFDFRSSRVFTTKYRFVDVERVGAERNEAHDTENSTDEALNRQSRHELDMAEEILRLLLQILLAPVKLISATSSMAHSTWLLEREMMHWLSLGSFSRSEVIMRMDMKLVEQVKQQTKHPWHNLEEEEIMNNVLENVGIYEDPSVSRGGAPNIGVNNLLGYGLKMSGTWKLKPELWTCISPFFECFTPSEAQQSEQNVRKNLPKTSPSTSLRALLSCPDDCSEIIQLRYQLAEKMLNSTYLFGVVFVVINNWKLEALHKSAHPGKAFSPSVTSENLIIAALSCLLVGVQTSESKLTDDESAKSRIYVGDHGGPNDSRMTVKNMAVCYSEENDSTFFAKFCTSIQTETGEDGKSLLSLVQDLLVCQQSLSPDIKNLAKMILDESEKKSKLCQTLITEKRRQQLETAQQQGDGPDDRTSSDSLNEGSDEQANKAKEMMRRRQQMILEKMRSQQMQFLSSTGANSCEPTQGMSDTTEELGDGENDELEEEEEEEDEWGFPTGQVDINLYLDHVTSAIAQTCEREKKMRDHKKRPRRSTSSSFGDALTLSDLSHEPSGYDSFGDEAQDEEQECGLCRLPCDHHSSESSFGFVAMSLPTKITQRIDDVSLRCNELPTFQLQSHGEEILTVKMYDSVVWSCGHPVHQSCLDAYLTSLWKQNAVASVNTDDRLLCERDLEFQCPICRRLSNCLLPSLPFARQSERASLSLGYEFEEESKEEAQELVFLNWLNAQITFPDAVTEARRRTRSMSLLRLRLNSSQTKKERDVDLENGVDSFSQGIILRCVRAAEQLPLLMSGLIQSENVIDEQIQLMSSTFTERVPSWQLLMRSLEVQVGIVVCEREMTTNVEQIDKQQLQSMRRLADVVVAAAAVSLRSMAWVVTDVPHGKRFDVVLSKLNSILFGHQVLFEDDDDSPFDEAGESEQRNSRSHGNLSLLSSPLICHPNLFAIFLMRMTWRRSVPAANTEIFIEQLVSEAFFLVRLLVTALILQSLCCIQLSDDTSDPDTERREASRAFETNVSDFSNVDSLKDAFTWITQVLVRSRLLSGGSNSQRRRPRPWKSEVMEEQLSALCLPVVKKMLVLMETYLPNSYSQSSHVNGDDVCAVCDGLYSASKSESGVKMAELEKYLRRLHLPPLRTFFQSQVFPASQRKLCELWGAQLESKAAVSRKQRAQKLDPCDRMFPMLKSSMNLISGERPRLFCELPRVYMDLFMKYNEKPFGICSSCHQQPQHPAVCLFCGVVLCCFSPCCESAVGNVGECSQHAQSCGLGSGAFLLLRACTVVLFLGNERRCVWGSVYVDKNGEEDPYLRRGKTLYLDTGRLIALETLMLSHMYTQNTAILANTSRRDGRRY